MGCEEALPGPLSHQVDLGDQHHVQDGEFLRHNGRKQGAAEWQGLHSCSRADAMGLFLLAGWPTPCCKGIKGRIS